jgi:hypothetical protein
MSTMDISPNPVTTERNFKLHESFVPTTDTSVMTAAESESSHCSFDQEKDDDYGYGDGSPDVAAKYGHEEGNMETRFSQLVRAVASGNRELAADRTNEILTSLLDKSIRRVSSMPFCMFSDSLDLCDVLANDDAKPVAGGRVRNRRSFLDREDSIGRALESDLAAPSEGHTRTPHAPRRSSMPGIASSSNATKPVAGSAGGRNRRSLLEREDSLGRALESDLAKVTDFTSERHTRTPRPHRRRSMPWSTSSLASAHKDKIVAFLLEKEESGVKRHIPITTSAPTSGSSRHKTVTPPLSKKELTTGGHFLHAVSEPPMPQLVYSIKFKRDTKDAVLCPRLVNRELPIGSYVKVKGDRGIDLGIVVEKISLQDYRSERKHYCVPELSQVICLAKQDEVSSLPIMRQEEQKLLWMCRDMAWQLGLRITVVDAEFQFDWNKLTFYYEADGRIDFRSLVRWLYSVCGIRIWMSQIFTTHTARYAPPHSLSAGGEPDNLEPATPIIAPQSEWLY